MTTSNSNDGLHFPPCGDGSTLAAPEPFRVDAPGEYLCRDDVRATVYAVDDALAEPVIGRRHGMVTSSTWQDSGRFLASREDPCDIVSRWIDAPAVDNAIGQRMKTDACEFIGRPEKVSGPAVDAHAGRKETGQPTPHWMDGAAISDPDGWRPWAGGECPTMGRVDFKRRDGQDFYNARAEELKWLHVFGEYNITHWRPHVEAAKPDEGRYLIIGPHLITEPRAIAEAAALKNGHGYRIARVVGVVVAGEPKIVEVK